MREFHLRVERQFGEVEVITITARSFEEAESRARHVWVDVVHVAWLGSTDLEPQKALAF